MRLIDLDGVLVVLGFVAVFVAIAWTVGPYALGICGFATILLAARGGISAVAR